MFYQKKDQMKIGNFYKCILDILYTIRFVLLYLLVRNKAFAELRYTLTALQIHFLNLQQYEKYLIGILHRNHTRSF